MSWKRTNLHKVFTITEKAPTRAFSWLKASTTAFTFKTLLRHYAKRALTPRSLNVKLGQRHNYHKGGLISIVAAFNQEKALVGAVSVITNLRMELFEALVDTRHPAVSACSIHREVAILMSMAACVTTIQYTTITQRPRECKIYWHKLIFRYYRI